MPDGPPDNFVVIKPSRGWGSLGLRDVWARRDLLRFFVWREIKGTYRQMALGPLWLILKPLMAMIVFAVIFGKLVPGISTEGLPGPLFYYAGLLPWYLFANAAASASGSLTAQRGLISKVYFPRLIVPIAAVLSSLIDFTISFCILLVMMLAYGRVPQATILLLPLFLLLAVTAALAIGLWLSSLAARFQDVGFAVGYLLQLWLYASPVIYPLSQVAERYQFMYRLNPMANIVEGCRWSLFGPGHGHAPDAMLGLSAAVIVVALLTGAYHFRHTERTVVDLM